MKVFMSLYTSRKIYLPIDFLIGVKGYSLQQLQNQKIFSKLILTDSRLLKVPGEYKIMLSFLLFIYMITSWLAVFIDINCSAIR